MSSPRISVPPGLLRALITLCVLILPSTLHSLGQNQTRQSASAHPRTLSAADTESLHQALDAYDQGQAAKAEPILRDLARRFPANFEANEALGSLYAEAGDFARALPYLEHARTLQPKQAIAHANVGAAYLKLNRVNDAVQELKTAANLDPGNAQTLSSLGQALTTKGEPAAAAQAFARAATAKPEDWNIRYDWGLALFASGSLTQAKAVLDSFPPQAVTDQVESLQADIAEKTGHFQEAVVHYQAAAKINVSDANLYTLIAELLRHWTWDEAIQIARYGEKLYPASIHFKLAEGIALYASSKYPASAAVFSALLNAEPDNALYADLLGRSCTLVPEGVSAECNGLLDFAHRHPENARAATYAATGILHRPQGQQDTTQAEALLHQAIAADPKLADAYFELGVLAKMHTAWKESVPMLEQAIALRPAFPEAHYHLSRAYAHLGQREDAQREIAIQQKYSQQAKDSLNARMQEVVTFVLKPN